MTPAHVRAYSHLDLFFLNLALGRSSWDRLSDAVTAGQLARKCQPEMFFSLVICIWVFVVWSGGVVGISHSSDSNSDGTYFVNPPSLSTGSSSDDLVYDLESIQEISWTTDRDVYNISIWQRDGDQNGSSTSGGNIFAKTTPSGTLTNFTWVVQTYSLDLSPPTFFLAIEAGSHKWTSEDFNITQSSSSSSPSSSDSTSTTNPPESEATSLTSTGKIALGLGAGIGAPLITLLAILAYFQYRSARRGYNSPPPHSQPHSHSSHQPPTGPYPPLSLSPSRNLPPTPAVEQMQMHQPAPLYRNLAPSELPPKLHPPVYLPPWEVHATRRSERERWARRTVRTSKGAPIPELPAQDFI
ncbi:hypothetical protein BJX99DRAFT_263971 [Aspergillus californicus]